MRTSSMLLATLKEVPADAEIVSHRLMLRAGLIRRVAAGIYTWLPIGLRVVRRIEQIVREELDRAGAREVLLPAVQPAELWVESGRWEQYGPELLRLVDRHDRDFCFGPTHEEVITELVRRELRSYKQLPLNLYQVQTKFRDEIRPRFGVMRAREFIMKDAYSFHMDAESLDETYQVMHACYSRIFERMGLDFRAVAADSGNIGGAESHEFHVLADSGEDSIAFSSDGNYAANVELAEAAPPGPAWPEADAAPMESVDTPLARTIEAVCEQLGLPPEQTVKSLIVEGDEGLVALILRGDHSLNEIKAAKIEGIRDPLTFASDADIRAQIGCGPGCLGPVGLSMPVVVDHAAAALPAFVCGANTEAVHLVNVNWTRDLDVSMLQAADLRNVVDGDPSPRGEGSLTIRRGIEVGHIFKLGTKYADAMQATVQDQDGQSRTLLMGCYGLGITRTVAAIIEQCHDERGIAWPESIAPFSIAVVPLNQQKSPDVREAAEQLYGALLDAGINALLDDREERPGVKFADMELLGIPHRVVIGDRALAAGEIEYQARRDTEAQRVGLGDALDFLRQRLAD